ncbi:MAG: ScyD/ScyE family protein [Propionicimonas sp.]|uniref:ScyD/ScyE family protein n=1 Tax=Propionicimonas sp. TaxID=1955623 RepID=UPI003D12FDD1
MRAVRISIAVAAVAVASTLVATAPADAHTTRKTSPATTVLTTAIGAPFNLDVRHGRILVADGAGQIGAVEADGSVSTVVGDVPGASGIATSRNGKSMAYTTSVVEGETTITASGLVITGPKGTIQVDTLAYEQANNPDGAIQYGVTNPDSCVTNTLTNAGFPVSYTGAIDSHAYSVAAYHGGWVVADAGANALLRVSRSGKVSTLAVLPAHPTAITQAAADAFGLDACAVGVTYAFESVPTDVEVGPDGFLYVTTLPGGPEDASLGARGKVFRVNPYSGRAVAIASGLLGATNLAFSRGGLYVTELFAGKVSLIRHGRVSSFLELPGALAVEAGPRGDLYVATGIYGPPSVVRVQTGGRGWRH